MKRLVSLVASLVVLASPVAVGVSAFAATETPSSTTTAIQKRDARIAAYKTKNAVKLAKAEETKLKGVCKAAQTKVTVLSDKSVKNNTARTTAYKIITDQLETIIPRLKDADIDTTDILKDQTKLEELVKTYTAKSLTYSDDLKDLAELDCQTDPAAFKAALLAARTDRPEVAKSAEAIKEYVKSNVKVSLQAAITELEAQKVTE